MRCERGAQVEQDLAYARLLAGLHGVRARREVAELVGFLVEVGAGLPLSEDKLTTIMEAAQVCGVGLHRPSERPGPASLIIHAWMQVMGLVGSTRKRILLLWQAVEFSRSCARPNLATLQARLPHCCHCTERVSTAWLAATKGMRVPTGLLRQIARKALEPAEKAADAEERGPDSQRPLPAGVPAHWSIVRCGCVEGALATAILAGQHADVWDAAALLLREHSRCCPLLAHRCTWVSME